MNSAASYLVFGKGRWGNRIHSILSDEGRVTEHMRRSVRRWEDEDEANYLARMMRMLEAMHSDIVWIALPPGCHIPVLIEASLLSDKHVVVEKPWIYPHSTARRLQHLAQKRRRFVSMHYEYCFLESLSRWKQQYGPGWNVDFGGRFHITAHDRLNIPAIENLGQHLLAIQAYVLPMSNTSVLDCRYGARSADRRIWVRDGYGELDEANFTKNVEPIIQRYIHHVEEVSKGSENIFDLDFASKVFKKQTKVAREIQRCGRSEEIERNQCDGE